MEGVGVSALVGLGALDGGHEGVGDGRVGRGVGGRGAVKGHREAEVEGLELEARRVRRVAGAAASVAEEGGGREGEERRHGVQRRRLGVATAARHRDCLVEGFCGVRRQALPSYSHRRWHLRCPIIKIENNSLSFSRVLSEFGVRRGNYIIYLLNWGKG